MNRAPRVEMPSKWHVTGERKRRVVLHYMCQTTWRGCKCRAYNVLLIIILKV